MDGVRVGRIEANQSAVRFGQNKDPDIASLGELVRGLPKVVVDLLDPAGKSRPIMPGGVERLDDALRTRLVIGHLISIVSL